MHDDEFEIDEPLVRSLLRRQFPRWAGLPLSPVEPAGTDNAIFRLGTEMAVRLPRIGWALDQPVKEHEWLPRLAPHLPLEAPAQLGLGNPDLGYPSRWSVCGWLPGEPASPGRLDDPDRMLQDLAAFIAALQGIDPAGGPAPDGRGEPLATRDEAMRDATAKLVGKADTGAVLASWEESLDAAEWSDPPVWIHGDLDARNLLAHGGRLSGVLDWGSLAVGDPACDVMVAWKMLAHERRTTFRLALEVDDATWLRARGWVLSQAAMILSYYTMETNPLLVTEATRWLAEALAVH